MRTAGRCISSLILLALGGAGAPPFSVLCPKARPGELVVCAERQPLRSPYRIPDEIAAEPIEGSRDTTSISRERNGLLDYDGGGIGSCSTSGAAGVSGCFVKRHKRFFEQKAQSTDKRGPIFASPH